MTKPMDFEGLQDYAPPMQTEGTVQLISRAAATEKLKRLVEKVVQETEEWIGQKTTITYRPSASATVNHMRDALLRAWEEDDAG